MEGGNNELSWANKWRRPRHTREFLPVSIFFRSKLRAILFRREQKQWWWWYTPMTLRGEMKENFFNLRKLSFARAMDFTVEKQATVWGQGDGNERKEVFLWRRCCAQILLFEKIFPLHPNLSRGREFTSLWHNCSLLPAATNAEWLRTQRARWAHSALLPAGKQLSANWQCVHAWCIYSVCASDVASMPHCCTQRRVQCREVDSQVNYLQLEKDC